jgi:hypothetical protein
MGLIQHQNYPYFSEKIMNHSPLGRHTQLLLVLAVASFIALAGCTSHDSEDAQPLPLSQDPGAPQPGQKLFNSPDAAAAALKMAFQTKDRKELKLLFGEEGRQLVFTGDRVQEDNDMEFYADRMAEFLRIDHPADNKAVLYIGVDNYPYPIPVVKADSQWFFDTAAGKEELLNRQIGDDELSVIAACRAFVAAEKEYAGKPRTADNVIQYAQHVMSTPGAKDGLFWEVGEGEALSPMGPEIAAARAEGYDVDRPLPGGKRQAYHGYYFHILKAQGDAAPAGRKDYVVDGKMTQGFALIAWPAKYGTSGIMTFTVNQDGKVYSKDLGQDTSEAVKGITEYNPDSSWKLE